jgi:hypothetical protein
MSFVAPLRPWGMSDTTQVPTTLSNIGVVMFTVADQDAAIAFYTRSSASSCAATSPSANTGEMRWVEVAPPGSVARLALNPPMNDTPGGGGIGVETADVLGRTRAA